MQYEGGNGPPLPFGIADLLSLPLPGINYLPSDPKISYFWVRIILKLYNDITTSTNF
jgi:hypothetical protein